MTSARAGCFGNGIVYVPDRLFRGRAEEFFTWSAANSGAVRRLRGQFTQAYLLSIWQSWAANNPDLVQS